MRQAVAENQPVFVSPFACPTGLEPVSEACFVESQLAETPLSLLTLQSVLRESLYPAISVAELGW